MMINRRQNKDFVLGKDDDNTRRCMMKKIWIESQKEQSTIHLCIYCLSIYLQFCLNNENMLVSIL